MRVIKILLCGLLLALPVFAEESDDRQTATSLHYVSHELDTRQDKLTAGTNAAITYTNAAGNVGQRTVKENLNGGTTDTSLPQVNAVNAGLSTKQDDIDPINDHTAVTYTGQTGQIGQKGIYQDSGTYATQSDNLIDAKTFNAALKNGLDSEFICAEYKPGTDLCWLWQIHTNTAPGGYTRLEYIESTGTQYINTGVTQIWQTGVTLEFSFTPTELVGYFGGNAYTQVQINNNYSVGVNTIVRTVFNGTSTSRYMNGVYRGTTDWPTSTYSGIPIILCALGYGASNVVNYSKGKLFYAKIFDENNSLVRDFIPVRQNSDKAIGMYDMVTETFFPNRHGTETFIAGPETNVYIPQNQ